MLENQMESDKMIEISEADFSELPEIAALEREIFPDAWSLKSLEETRKQKNAAILERYGIYILDYGSAILSSITY